MEFKDCTLEGFCAQVASDEPVPGGGTVAAASGAVAASLAEMVFRLTLAKAEEKPLQMTVAADRLAALRGMLLHEADRDSESYRAVIAAFRLPKATDAEKQARSAAIQKAFVLAAETPLRVAELCLEVEQLAGYAIAHGRPSAVTDAMVSAMTARSAALGAAANVRINLSSIRDEAARARMAAAVERIETEARSSEDRHLAASGLYGKSPNT